MVFGVMVCMFLGKILGVGLVSVKMIGWLVMWLIILVVSMLGLDRFRNMLVLLIIFVSVCLFEFCVNLVFCGVI